MAKKQKKFIKTRIKSRGDIKERVPLIRVLYLSFMISVVALLLMFIFKDRLPPEIPLFYGLPEGPGQLAQKKYLVIPSILALTFNFINTGIVVITKNDFLKRTLIITGLVLSIFAVITTLKIMFLVGNL